MLTSKTAATTQALPMPHIRNNSLTHRISARISETKTATDRTFSYPPSKTAAASNRTSSRAPISKRTATPKAPVCNTPTASNHTSSSDSLISSNSGNRMNFASHAPKSKWQQCGGGSAPPPCSSLRAQHVLQHATSKQVVLAVSAQDRSKVGNAQGRCRSYSSNARLASRGTPSSAL